MKDFSAYLTNFAGAWPSVTAVNDTTGTAQDGTEWVAALIDDWWGFDQAIMSEAGFTPDGNDEVYNDSQKLRALRKIFGQQTIPRNYTETDIAAKRWDRATVAAGASWARMQSIGNSISVGGATQLIDLCVGFDGDQRILVALDSATCEFHKYNCDTLALIGSSGALTGLGAGTWVPTACCSDGTNIFIMFWDSVGGSHKVHCYLIADYSQVWGAPTVLAAGAVGVNPVSTDQHDRVIIANDTSIACCNSWVAAAAANSRCIEIIGRAAGGVTAFGPGDATLSATSFPCGGGLATDNTNVFYSVKDNASVNWTEVCSVSIANPLVGSGGLGWPYSSAQTAQCRGITYDGDIIYSSWAASANLQMHRVSDATSGEIETLAASTGDPRDLTFDGMKLWAYSRNIETAGDWGLMCWDVAGLAASTTDNTQANLSPKRFMFDLDEHPVVTTLQSSRIVFDGRDVWMVADRQSGQPLSGIIRRVPRAMIR